MTTYVNCSCQCELHAFRVAFDSKSLPISNEICHCSTCRHSSGQMALAHVAIKGEPLTRVDGLSVHSSRSPSRIGFRSTDNLAFEKTLSRSLNSNSNSNSNHHHSSSSLGFLVPPAIYEYEDRELPYELGDMTTYKTSSDVTRYFCTSCSAQLFWVHHVDGQNIWNVSVGVLERTDGLIKRGCHIWIGDTLDGGIADHLQVVEGVRLPRYKGEEDSEELPLGWKDDRLATAAADPTNKIQLKGYCHCKTISFTITRPSEASFLPSAAYPDLLYPFYISHMSKVINPQDEKWWLRPRWSPHPSRYLAGHCMCNFCRHCSGFEVQSWAYIPLANILGPDGKTPLCLETEEKRPAGLGQFISSPGTYREFCKTCGATAFAWKAGTPTLINVAVGLLDEENCGARAEDWLEWHKDRVGFQEKALSASLARALQDGMKHSV